MADPDPGWSTDGFFCFPAARNQPAGPAGISTLAQDLFIQISKGEGAEGVEGGAALSLCVLAVFTSSLSPANFADQPPLGAYCHRGLCLGLF